MVQFADINLLRFCTEQIRNICLLAHVDHGKTTLCDHLIATNSVISKKQAGEIRFLDNTLEEQTRHITMKASSISLVHTKVDKKKDQAQRPFLINLIDSPGHVDFSAEALTAIRLSDGALIVVDVVEGVCSQTEAVLRHAWAEGLRPVLVLNKMDRLIMELEMDEGKALHHLKKIIEHINALVVSFHTEEIMVEQADQDLLELNERKIWKFDPLENNVIFCSAFHKWGFSLKSIAKYWEMQTSSKKKKGMRAKVLSQYLWGEYYYDMKHEKVSKKPLPKQTSTMFVQFALEPIWMAYKEIKKYTGHTKKIQKLIKKLKLKVPSRELESHELDPMITAILSQWLPISDSLLSCICSAIPNPAKGQKRRMKRTCEFPNPYLKKALRACDKRNDVGVGFISKSICCPRKQVEDAIKEKHIIPKKPPIRDPLLKLFPMEFVEELAKGVEEKQLIDQFGYDIVNELRFSMVCQIKLNQHGHRIYYLKSPGDYDIIDVSKIEQTSEDFQFVSMARVYSGTLYDTDSLYIIQHGKEGIQRKRVRGFQLFHFMGAELRAVDRVPAGNVFGISGLDSLVSKTAIISTHLPVPKFRSIEISSSAVVRVAIHPVRYDDMKKLEHALDHLNHADNAVEAFVNPNGEYIIGACGELHLQRCINHLRKRFAPNVKFRVSKPIVSFKETIVPMKKKLEEKLFVTPNGLCSFAVRAVPIPEDLMETLQSQQKILNRLYDHMSSMSRGKPNVKLHKDYRNFLKKCGDSLSRKDELTPEDLSSMITFGPRKNGENLFIIREPSLQHQTIDNLLLNGDSSDVFTRSVIQSLCTGFNLSISAGPMCKEPMFGVAFILDVANVKPWKSESDGLTHDPHGPVGGQIVSIMKGAYSEAFLSRSARLIQPMYKCFLQATSMVLGSLHTVLQKRRAKIVDEKFIEGTDLFDVISFIPVVTSFGFVRELRQVTAGRVVPQLMFSHWDILDEDPYWTPTTEEELEEFGAEANVENYAKRLVEQIRTRKGLYVEKKIVEAAEKQRTLARKK